MSNAIKFFTSLVFAYSCLYENSFALAIEIQPQFYLNNGAWPASYRYVVYDVDCTYGFSRNGIELRKNKQYAPCPFFNLEFYRPSPNATLIADRETTTKNRLYRANGSVEWATFRRLRYQNIYPGIDTEFYFNQHQLEYDFIVGANANTDSIVITFPQSTLSLRQSGDIIITSGGHTTVLRKPFAYQWYGQTRKPIDVEYRIHNRSPMQVSFELGHYDKTKPLVIDPVIEWKIQSISGNESEYLSDIKVIGQDSVVITGSTTSTQLSPFLRQQRSVAAKQDIFVAKLSLPDLQPQFITYINGSDQDISRQIEIDSSGNLFIVAETLSTDLPLLENGLAAGGNWDIYIAKLDPEGRLLSTTYHGGNSFDYPHAAAVDSNGKLIVAGETWSKDFPTTENGFTHNCRDIGICAMANGFIIRAITDTKISIDSSSIFGGSGIDAIHAIDVDEQNNLHIAGETDSSDLPLYLPLQNSLKGSYDGFIAIFDLDQAGHDSLKFSTYFGGAAYDSFRAIKAASFNKTIVGGETASSDFPSNHTTYSKQCQENLSCVSTESDAVIVEIDHTLHDSVQHAVRYGGSGNDEITQLVANSSVLYALGKTSSNDLPVRDNGISSLCNLNKKCDDSNRDLFVTQWDFNRRNDQLRFSTYIGGSGDESNGALQVIADRTLIVAGTTESTDLALGASPLPPKVDTDGFLIGTGIIPTGGALLNITTPSHSKRRSSLNISFLLPLLIIIIAFRYNKLTISP